MTEKMSFGLDSNATSVSKRKANMSSNRCFLQGIWMMESCDSIVKGIQYRFLSLKMAYAMMCAEYYYASIYQRVYRMNAQSIIAYSKKNDPESIGFNKHLAPTCLQEHSYRYDSYHS